MAKVSCFIILALAAVACAATSPDFYSIRTRSTVYYISTFQTTRDAANRYCGNTFRGRMVYPRDPATWETILATINNLQIADREFHLPIQRGGNGGFIWLDGLAIEEAFTAFEGRLPQPADTGAFIHEGHWVYGDASAYRYFICQSL